MAAEGELKANEDAKENVLITIIDPTYEFSAPRFYDFIDEETEEEKRRAELWFDTALSHGPSPFMSRVKTGRRSLKVEALCDFSEAEQTHKGMKSDGTTNCSEEKLESGQTAGTGKEAAESKSPSNGLPKNEVPVPEEPGKIDGPDACLTTSDCKTKQLEAISSEKVHVGPPSQGVGVHTPKPHVILKNTLASSSKKNLTAQKIASLIKNPSALKHRNPMQSSQVKCKTMLKTETAKRDINSKDASTSRNLAQENQAIKRQKLEGGKSRQILNIKPQILTHKSKLGLPSHKSGLCSSSASSKTRKEDRKMYVREPSIPFISAAEMITKFQSRTRDLSLPFSSVAQKGKLTLTRPKEPEFKTAQRVRLVKVKSAAEIEEEMMAKIPKFKARPVNKKILDAPALPAPQRSAPKLPAFQEFHLKTMERADSNAESASIPPPEMNVIPKTHEWKPLLTEPRAPTLQTSLRARPSTVKSSVEVEQEELEKAPKFKARPLNKKIFEGKENLGMFCNAKKLVTIPQEFHFATDERFPPPAAMCDMFDKLSLKSEPQQENPLPKKTAPNPFHLHTEEIGAEKEKKFRTELTQKQSEEERARIPKASPFPYTTDFPVVPPKPEPKHCTKPEPFQLESLVRHEEELHKEMEKWKRIEREEAELRIFKAQPVLNDRDPIPVPEKVRRPLTQVQEFNLQSDNRAVDRAEYDQKIKEKDVVYKRHREEIDAAKMMEEEKALKQLRRTLVHHSRPVPNFSHPFHPQKSSKETTKAKSPKLRVLRRKDKDAVAARYGSSSAAATSMR